MIEIKLRSTLIPRVWEINKFRQTNKLWAVVKKNNEPNSSPKWYISTFKELY
jgi:hypothetical protein